jgi:hypothetical protein
MSSISDDDDEKYSQKEAEVISSESDEDDSIAEYDFTAYSDEWIESKSLLFLMNYENPKTNPLLSFTFDVSELQAASPTHSLEDLCAIPTEDSLVAAIESNAPYVRYENCGVFTSDDLLRMRNIYHLKLLVEKAWAARKWLETVTHEIFISRWKFLSKIREDKFKDLLTIFHVPYLDVLSIVRNEHQSKSINVCVNDAISLMDNNLLNDVAINSLISILSKLSINLSKGCA